jgi:hypothetical protein
MTQDEIRTIAKKAGFLTGLTQDNKPFIWHLFVEDNNLLPEIELFAKLISEVEQKKYEEIAMKVAEEAIDLAMSLEREACAEILDANAMACNSPIMRSLLQSNAQAIRARGQA